MAKSKKDAGTGAVEEAQAKTPGTPTDTFKVGGKQYQFTTPQFHVPGIGIVTAAEALQDGDAQEALGGKSIKEWLVEVGAAVVAEV